MEDIMHIQSSFLRGVAARAINNTFYGSRVDEEGMPCLVLDYNTPPKWLGY